MKVMKDNNCSLKEAIFVGRRADARGITRRSGL
jgi:hypothetical protein